MAQRDRADDVHRLGAFATALRGAAIAWPRAEGLVMKELGQMALSLAVATVMLAGCSSTDSPAAPPADGGLPAADTRTNEVATEEPDTMLGEPDAPAVDSGACSTCAKLVGKVMRTTSAKPQHGGKGKVYLAVFDHDPVGDRMSAKVVGQALLPSVDFNADTASIAYEVDGLVPRSSAYYVIAFLDDDGNAASTGPAPSKGDLVSLDGISAPKVVLASAGSVTLDLPLNMAMPF